MECDEGKSAVRILHYEERLVAEMSDENGPNKFKKDHYDTYRRVA